MHPVIGCLLLCSSSLVAGGEVSGRIWLDGDGDAQAHEKEPGLPGVEVCLIRSGEIVGRAVSDGAGRYVFTGLPPGPYKVRALPPFDKHFTTAPDGVSANLVVASGVRFSGVNFGLQAAVVSEDLDVKPVKAWFKLPAGYEIPPATGEIPGRDAAGSVPKGTSSTRPVNEQFRP